MKQALLVTNAFLRTPSFENLHQALLAEANRQGLQLIHHTNKELLGMAGWSHLPTTVLFWDKDVRLAALMAQEGMRLFNTARAIALCDDKTLTYIKLKEHGIPMPDTLLCPMTFPGAGYGDMAFADIAAEKLGLPFIIKEGCGSFGQQVYLAHTIDEGRDIIRRVGARPMLFQRLIQESAGRDIRVYIVNGQAVAAIVRTGPAGDFRSNIAGGGSAAAHALTPAEESLALSACRALGLHFGGVDLLMARDGPLVCEVNSNAHFAGLHRATGINPAEHIIALIREAAP